jgi:H+-translocating NAD(P) transhydrogenase subunit alpha
MNSITKKNRTTSAVLLAFLLLNGMGCGSSDNTASKTAAPALPTVVENPAMPGAPPAITTPITTSPVTVMPVDVAVKPVAEPAPTQNYSSLLFVFMLATFIGLGVILRVSRLLHTPLMSLTNAISAIAVVGSIIVVGEGSNPWGVRLLGAIALFASMTNIVSGFLITDRMLKMFKTPGEGGKR